MASDSEVSEAEGLGDISGGGGKGFLGYGGDQWEDSMARGGDHSRMLRRTSLSAMTSQLESEEQRGELLMKDMELRNEMVVKRLKSELEEMRADAIQATQIIGTLNSENESLKMELSSVGEETAMLKGELSMMTDKCEVMEEMLMEARQGLEQRDLALEDMNERVAEMQRLLNDAQTRAMTASSGMDHAPLMRTETSGRLIEVSQALFDEKLAVKDEEIADLKELCTQLNETVEAMQNEMDELAIGTDEMAEMRDEFFKAQELMATDLEEMEAQNGTLANEVIELAARNANLENERIQTLNLLEEREYKCQMLEKLCQLSGVKIPTEDPRDAITRMNRRNMTMNVDTIARRLSFGGRRDSASMTDGSMGRMASSSGFYRGRHSTDASADGTLGSSDLVGGAADLEAAMALESEMIDDDEDETNHLTGDEASDAEVDASVVEMEPSASVKAGVSTPLPVKDTAVPPKIATPPAPKKAAPVVPDVIREYLHLTASATRLKYPKSQLSSEQLIEKVRNKQFFEYYDHMILILRTEEAEQKKKAASSATSDAVGALTSGRSPGSAAPTGGRARSQSRLARAMGAVAGSGGGDRKKPASSTPSKGKTASQSWYEKWGAKFSKAVEYFTGEEGPESATGAAGGSGAASRARPIGSSGATLKSRSPHRSPRSVGRKPRTPGSISTSAPSSSLSGSTSGAGSGKTKQWWRAKYSYGGSTWFSSSAGVSGSRKATRSPGGKARDSLDHPSTPLSISKSDGAVSTGSSDAGSETELKSGVSAAKKSSSALKIPKKVKALATGASTVKSSEHNALNFSESHAGITTPVQTDDEGPTFEVVKDPKVSDPSKGKGSTSSKIRGVKRRRSIIEKMSHSLKSRTGGVTGPSTTPAPRQLTEEQKQQLEKQRLAEMEISRVDSGRTFSKVVSVPMTATAAGIGSPKLDSVSDSASKKKDEENAVGGGSGSSSSSASSSSSVRHVADESRSVVDASGAVVESTFAVAVSGDQSPSQVPMDEEESTSLALAGLSVSPMMVGLSGGSGGVGSAGLAGGATSPSITEFSPSSTLTNLGSAAPSAGVSSSKKRKQSLSSLEFASVASVTDSGSVPTTAGSGAVGGSAGLTAILASDFSSVSSPEQSAAEKPTD